MTASHVQWKIVKPQKRQLVPISPLEGYQVVPDREEAAAPEAIRVSPFKRHHISGLMYGFRNADHLGARELSREHGPNGFAPSHGIRGYLVICRIFRIEGGETVNVPGVE